MKQNDYLFYHTKAEESKKTWEGIKEFSHSIFNVSYDVQLKQYREDQDFFKQNNIDIDDFRCKLLGITPFKEFIEDKTREK